ncbi:transposase [Bradyrhizobium sp.]|uniref:transposase n=1 Tax=Bradyrhizobium sp. TaxID=376 RepID=UPI003C6FB400
MRRSQHTEHEILFLLEEADAGISIAEICSTARVSLRTFYRWRKRYRGLTSSALRHMKELEIENQRLRLLLDKLSEQRDSAHAQSPVATRLQLPRQEFGSGRPAAAEHSRGASLGRFASVRCMR